MERHQHAMLIFSHLGQVRVYASHKPELLTTSMMVSIGTSYLWGETIYVVPIEFIYKGNIELHECPVNFWNYSGFVWPYLHIN